MAGDWIKVQVTTPDKPEIWKMAEILDIDPDAVVGKLIRIWAWADQQTFDGNAHTVTSALLNRIAGVTKFTEAMLQVGWLVKSDDGYAFPNFDDHNGKTAKNRAATNKRVAKSRNVTGEKQKCNAETVTKTVTREEKRREENISNKKNNTKKSSASKKLASSDLDFSSWPEPPSDDIWAQYKKLRQAKRAPVTQVVINSMGAELNKLPSGDWSTDSALSAAIVAGWQGFKAEWLINSASGAQYKSGNISQIPKFSDVTNQNLKTLEGWANG